jgi:hypothetical protein
MLTQDEKKILRKIIAKEVPGFVKAMEEYAAKTDEEIRAEIVAYKARKLAQLQEQRTNLNNKISELGE